jgi:hypothetical protein
MIYTLRPIEGAFPPRRAPLDSGHERNARHGRILTLHIRPVRRPPAAAGAQAP